MNASPNGDAAVPAARLTRRAALRFENRLEMIEYDGVNRWTICRPTVREMMEYLVEETEEDA